MVLLSSNIYSITLVRKGVCGDCIAYKIAVLVTQDYNIPKKKKNKNKTKLCIVLKIILLKIIDHIECFTSGHLF